MTMSNAVGRYSSETKATNRPWVDSPFFANLLKTALLSPEQARMVSDFAQHGYVIIDPEIPGELLDDAVREMTPFFRDNYEPYYSDRTRIQDGWTFLEPVRQIAIAPKILEVLRILYQREPVPFQTINFRVGSQQRTHSDTVHFSSIPHGFMCGAWVALEDVDARNGPLHYYPASQHLPIYDLHDIGIAASFQQKPYDNYGLYEDFVEALMKAEQYDRREIKVSRGECLIWAANLFHGGSPIVDEARTRHTQVTHYYFDGCLYYTPLLSDPGLGRLQTRKVYDARTKQPVQQHYNGLPILNPGEWPPRTEADPPLIQATPKTGESRVDSILARLRRRLDSVR